MLRVRQLTDPLVPCTDQLISDGILPANIKTIFELQKTVRYPPFVYTLHKTHKWAFSHFGVFMEALLSKMLVGEWKAGLYQLYTTTAEYYTKDDITDIVSKDDLYKAMGRFVNIEKYIVQKFGDKKILYNQELQWESITGHPDVVIGDCIYDVKTVTKFSTVTTKNQAILQLSAYLALAQASGKKIRKIGVILPSQQTTLTYKLTHTTFDHTPFLSLLLQNAQARLCTLQQMVELETFTPLIGNHTQKIGGTVYKSLLNYYSTRAFTKPCQIFMRGNRGAKSVKLTDTDIAQSLAYIEANNIKYFVHASYAINLCHPCGIKTKDPEPDPWATRILREDLELCNVSGGRGVVVHTGKGMHLSEEEAYTTMYESVLSVLDSATEECPLMIETPCDKGTELCGSVESFAAFYKRFTAEQQTKIKICVDTCHVFASGYYPYDYLLQLSELIGSNAIALIHLNDSQWGKGSCHDGHQWVGRGCIGMTEMLKAISWCAARSIPMVHE